MSRYYSSVNSQVVPIKSVNNDKVTHDTISVASGESKESDIISVHTNKSFGSVILEFLKTSGNPSCTVTVKYRMRGSSYWKDAITLKSSFAIGTSKVLALRLDAELAANWIPNTEMVYIFTASGGDFTVRGEHGV